MLRLSDKNLSILETEADSAMSDMGASIAPKRNNSETTLVGEKQDDDKEQMDITSLKMTLPDECNGYTAAEQELDFQNAKKSSSTKTSNSATVVCVIGIGYVGETLVSEFSTCYKVIGFDVSEKRVEYLKTQYSGNNNVYLTANTEALAHGTHFLISVPTLINPDNSIDTTHILSAISTVVSHARPGSTIVIESSVCVGMTRQLLGPYLTTYHCGMSPERVDPGRTFPTAYDTPKIVSGITATALKKVQTLYQPVFRQLVPVSSPEVAEMTKLYENCFRMVNIAYVNEIADACASHGIDASEVTAAAATKPFGFMSFAPGLGVGGHCIPINPRYLAVNCNLPILEKATKKMVMRPAKIARDFYKSAKASMKAASSDVRTRKPRILVVGLAFKPGQSLMANSPGLAFAQTIKTLGASDVTYYDPMVEQKNVSFARKLKDKEWNARTLEKRFDAIAVCMKQKGVDMDVLEHVNGAYIEVF